MLPIHTQYLCFEVLRVGGVIENFNKIEKDGSLLLNGVLLGYLSLEVGGEKLKRRDILGLVDFEGLNCELAG